MTKIDVDFINTNGYFDLYIGETSGTLGMTEGLNTAILISLFTDRRANATEVQQPYARRGWWGNLLNDDPNFQLGSKLWLFDQVANTEANTRRIEDAIRECLVWMVEDQIFTRIDVSVTRSYQKVTAAVELIRRDGSTESKFYDLINATEIKFYGT